MPRGTGPLLLPARVICGALLLGVLFYAALAVALADRSSAFGREVLEGRVGPQRMLKLLIAAWALLEAVGIFGITVYLLTGRTEVLVLSVLVVVAGTARSFPRSEWFAPFRRGALPG